MKNIKIIFSYFIFIVFLNSCGTMSDAGKVLRNEKKRTTDEFLVKKREPLSYPPDYRTLPKPESEIKEKGGEEKTITNILKMPQEKVNQKNNSSSVEESIINQISK